MMEGIDDIAQTVTHEWIHGLIDWALLDQDGKPGSQWFEKYKYDEEGEWDHFIIRLINFD